MPHARRGASVSGVLVYVRLTRAVLLRSRISPKQLSLSLGVPKAPGARALLGRPACAAPRGRELRAEPGNTEKNCREAARARQGILGLVLAIGTNLQLHSDLFPQSSTSTAHVLLLPKDQGSQSVWKTTPLLGPVAALP